MSQPAASPSRGRAAFWTLAAVALLLCYQTCSLQGDYRAFQQRRVAPPLPERDTRSTMSYTLKIYQNAGDENPTETITGATNVSRDGTILQYTAGGATQYLNLSSVYRVTQTEEQAESGT